MTGEDVSPPERHTYEWGNPITCVRPDNPHAELRLIRILMCWVGEEKEITFVEVTKDTI